MSEQWRPIPGYEGFYEVSDLGRVRSLGRISQPGLRGFKGRVLSERSRRGRYRAAHLCKPSEKEYIAYVHHLVLLAFVGPRPLGTVACHNNGDRDDNRLANLRWDTLLANSKDAISHGTVRRGSRNPSAKLVEEDVVRIREMILFGANRREVEATFGICRLRADCIVSRGTWKHVP